MKCVLAVRPVPGGLRASLPKAALLVLVTFATLFPRALVADTDALLMIDQATGIDGGHSCTDCGDQRCECRPADTTPELFGAIVNPHLPGGVRWIGRVDALVLWRNAPTDRPLLETSTGADPVLDADELDSPAAAGPRFSIFRANTCTGHAIEATYLRASNFGSVRHLPPTDDFQYALVPPGIYSDVPAQPFDSGTVKLGGRLQSFEFNRHMPLAENVRWLAGFRWLEWQEQFKLTDTVNAFSPIDDFYQTSCFNDLYGGQVGIDMTLLGFRWVRVDSVVKAGAYYNNAVQSSEYSTTDPANPGTASISVGKSPASCSFAGEVGLTAVIPVTHRIDVRLGYFGLWLTELAQPTRQLTGQNLIPGEPIEGSLDTNGAVVLQGLSVGLEGRW